MHFQIEPGVKTMGIARVKGSKLVWVAELTDRGFYVRDALTTCW
ncbi:hypothetical protein LYNGBM3L_30760 [Moorena producens 3L]|uniref:Uncharacterized protein n=1 Tax=Moorena producens 3L TaxID=489825 RepID=F4XTM9_9CYAN|nr:hypothetical protein LYNGBM3L_30760 [Moorena producens 3L]